MTSKVLTYLNRNKKQNTAYKELQTEILDICRSYNIKPEQVYVFDKHDALSIEIANEFDSQVIPVLNDYVGLPAKISQYHLRVQLFYQVPGEDTDDDA